MSALSICIGSTKTDMKLVLGKLRDGHAYVRYNGPGVSAAAGLSGDDIRRLKVVFPDYLCDQPAWRSCSRCWESADSACCLSIECVNCERVNLNIRIRTGPRTSEYWHLQGVLETNLSRLRESARDMVDMLEIAGAVYSPYARL